MFAQYGVKAGNLNPWADMFIVDMEKNDFVPNGATSYVHDGPISAGQNGSGAFFRLLARNTSRAEKHGIVHPNQGQPLYIALEGDPAFDADPITFRDFASGIVYKAHLEETVTGSGANVQSSFFITLDRTEKGGTTKTFKIGSPGIKRPRIFSYRIRNVLVNSSGNSLIFVIEMKRRSETGHDIRYMVEAIKF
jgi:predicted secreted protein